MRCRHMVLHQMGDELDGPSPIYPCDGEAATGDSFGGLEGDELTIAHPRDIGGVAATLKGRKTLAVARPFWAHAQDTVFARDTCRDSARILDVVPERRRGAGRRPCE